MFYEIIYERKAHLIYVQKNKHSFFGVPLAKNDV